MIKIKAILILLVLVSTANCTQNYDDDDDSVDAVDRRGYKEYMRRKGFCFDHNDCGPKSYCHYFPDRGNECGGKSEDGELCVSDFYCENGYCVGFRCTSSKAGPNDPPNGPCEENVDCHPNQYCKSRKCVDRISRGWCTKNGQCLSNLCNAFRCSTPRTVA